MRQNGEMLFGESSERKQLEQLRRSEGRLPPGVSSISFSLSGIGFCIGGKATS
jgi:hypothetical protein